MCLGNISKDCSVLDMKKNRIKWLRVDFSVDCNIIDVDDIINIYKYLMKKRDIKLKNIKKLFFNIGFIKKNIGISSSVVNSSNHTKCIMK